MGHKMQWFACSRGSRSRGQYYAIEGTLRLNIFTSHCNVQRERWGTHRVLRLLVHSLVTLLLVHLDPTMSLRDLSLVDFE
jgi:hypothetical protein